MGQGTSYTGAGKTREEAVRNLLNLLRCYVDNDYRGGYVIHRDSDGIKRKTWMIIDKNRDIDIIIERNIVNTLYGARVIL